MRGTICHETRTNALPQRHQFLLKRIPYSQANGTWTSYISERVRIRNLLGEFGSGVRCRAGDVVCEYVIVPSLTRGQRHPSVKDKGRRYGPVENTHGRDIGLLRAAVVAVYMKHPRPVG